MANLEYGGAPPEQGNIVMEASQKLQQATGQQATGQPASGRLANLGVANFRLVEPTMNIAQKNMPTTMLKFWGLQILVGIMMYLVIIIIIAQFGQRDILGNVLVVLVLILGNTYMVTKFQNLDGCYKKLG